MHIFHVFLANLCLYFHSPFTPAPWRAQIHTKKQFFQRNTDRTTKWIMQIDVWAHFLFFQPTLSLPPSPLTSVPFNSCTTRSLNPKQKKALLSYKHWQNHQTNHAEMEVCAHLLCFLPNLWCFLLFPFHTCVKKTCSYTYTPPSVCGPTFSYILMRRLQL